MWQRDGKGAGKSMKWQEAIDYCNNLDYGGHSDWRLPNKEELKALADIGGNRPSEYFNGQGFKNVQSSYYWSSTTYADFMYDAWSVLFYNGYVYNSNKTNSYYARCVRAGQ